VSGSDQLQFCRAQSFSLAQPSPDFVGCAAWASRRWYKKYVSSELGVKVPALDDTRSARLNGEEEAGVFELYNTDDTYRMLFWRNVTGPVEVDLGTDGSWDATHVDWWAMKLTPIAGAPLVGKVNITPPAGQDAIVQLIRKG
jgi:hypothetical protein